MAALLERERELGEIEAALGEVGAGKGCAIGIEASAGLGKTRLLQESREVATSAGLNVLSARATELEREFPFALVRQLLEPQLAALSAGERDELFEGATAARGALGLDPNGESGHDAFAVLHGLYWVTAALAERRPLLLAVDDAHVADAASLDLLGFLLPRLEELPVLLVIANRPDEPDPTEGLRRVLTDPAMHHLAPRPLSAEATSMLLGEGLGRQPEPAFAAACHEVSGGNPFLLSELARTLAERKIEPVADQAELVGELAPDRVAQTVLPRIERLAPEAAAVARALAILGEGVDVRLVAELASLAPATARVVADELRAAAILDSGAPLRFIHPLVRNAVYADIPAGERARCHALAATLLRQDGAPLAQVATQLLASEPEGDREAVETLIDAGEGALVTGAPRSAIAYLRRAIDQPPPEDLRAAVLEPLITACFRAVDHQAWAEAEPHVFAELEREPSLRSRWATPLTWVMAMSGRFEEAASMLVQAVEVTIAEDDVESAFQLEAQLNTLGQMVPSGVPEVDLSRYLDKIDPDSPGGRLAAVIEARAAAVSGSARDAAAAAKRALANDAVIFAEEPELASSFIAVSILVIADELDFAAHAAERSLAIARERGATPEIARGLYLRGIVAYAFGDLVNAEADLRQALDMVRLAGIPPLVMMYAGPLIVVLTERDELEAAEEELRALGLASGPMPDQPIFSLLLLARGQLRFERGEFELALEDLLALSVHAEIMGAGEGPELMVCPMTVRALIARGERERARDHADRILAAAERWGTPLGIAFILRAVADAQGGAEGIERLEEAAALLDGSPRNHSRAQVLLDLGEALRRAGRRTEAREPLREALKLARQGGATRVAKRAHEELQATGEKVRRYAPIGIEALTPSERRVAELAASGMTNRQIAQSLFVTVKTVEAHLSAAYDKLDIDSRKQLPEALGERASRSP